MRAYGVFRAIRWWWYAAQCQPTHQSAQCMYIWTIRVAVFTFLRTSAYLKIVDSDVHTEQMLTAARVRMSFCCYYDYALYIYSSITKINCYMTGPSLTLIFRIGIVFWLVSTAAWTMRWVQNPTTPINVCYSSKMNTLIDCCGLRGYADDEEV